MGFSLYFAESDVMQLPLVTIQLEEYARVYNGPGLERIYEMVHNSIVGHWLFCHCVICNQSQVIFAIVGVHLPWRNQHNYLERYYRKLFLQIFHDKYWYMLLCVFP